jgi:hypothetical protein
LHLDFLDFLGTKATHSQSTSSSEDPRQIEGIGRETLGMVGIGKEKECGGKC